MRTTRTTMRTYAVVVGALALSVLLPSTAFAERPELFVFAGTSRGSERQRLTTFEDGCVGCSKAGVSSSDGHRTAPSLALLAAGLVGSEGQIRGGAEVYTLLEMGEQTTGYTAVLTYAGLERGRLFGMIGLGLGSYWGADRLGQFGSLAGSSVAEAGLRLTQHIRVLVRGDVMANSSSVNPVVTLGLQLLPGARI